MKIIDDFLPLNGFSRPGRMLDAVKLIIIHYPGVAMQRARAVRDYWAGLASQDAMDAKPDTSASAHYAVDLDGTILRTVPETEKAYHVGSSQPDPASGKIYTDLMRVMFGEFNPLKWSPNRVCVGIEMCHINSEGQHTPDTIQATAELCADLCKRFGLDPRRHILTHKDVVGWKSCNLWYVNHPTDFEQFKLKVLSIMEG